MRPLLHTRERERAWRIAADIAKPPEMLSGSPRQTTSLPDAVQLKPFFDEIANAGLDLPDLVAIPQR
jgi:hypothetical protein